MPRLNKAALQKHLQQLEKEELITEILRLFTKFKPVNEHFQMEFGETTAVVVEAYKEKMRKVFFGNRVRRPRLSTAKKIISEFKKVALFDYDVIDLLLFRVENSVQFANTFNYPNESFYKSIFSTFSEAVQLIATHQLQSEFKDRSEKIVWFAGQTHYFSLHQLLWQLYQEAFEHPDWKD